MRVLFLTHRLPYAPNRGDRIRAHHMLRTLAQHADVELVSLVHDRDEETRIVDLKTLASHVTTARVRPASAPRRALRGLAAGTPLTHALLHADGIGTAIEEAVAARRPDVVLAYCSGMARFALEHPLRRFPLVIDMVDVDSKKWAAMAASTPAPMRWIYRREASRLAAFESAAAARAHVTTVVNERERSALADLCPRAPIAVVPNGIDIEFFRPPRPAARSPHVVFCGVMSYKPNEQAALWFAQHVWPRVLARRPDARLSLVGSSPGRKLMRLAQERSIEVTGPVPDVRPYLWRSAVSIAPIWTARGVQNKVLEAAAAGLPSVVTPTVYEGLPPQIAPACTLADTAAAFAASVLMLLDSSPAERRAAAAAAELESLSWSRQLAPLPDLLDAAAKSSTRRRYLQLSSLTRTA